MWFGTKDMDVKQFHVFGCPCIAQLHSCQAISDQDRALVTLTSKNITQRGVRGIFIGLPVNQAGWLVHVPASNKVFVSIR